MDKQPHKNRAVKPVKKVTTDELDRLLSDFQKVAATKSGQNVFRWIMNQCGFKAPSVVREMVMSENGQSIHVGDILPLSTTYNESRRDVWLNIRNHIKPEFINIIEMETIDDAPRNNERKQPSK